MSFPRPQHKSLAIAPSILSANFAKLSEEVKKIQKAGADWVHVDVMDGHFVPNITVGPVVVKWLKKHTSLPLDVHLMIENPEKYIPQFAQAGGDLLTVHWEACQNVGKVIRLIKKQGCRVGMSICPKTPVQKLSPYMKELDLLLVMTVEPGFGGQSFMADMLPKIKWARQKFRQLSRPAWVEVDGGINSETVGLTTEVGANALVAGNAIFGAAHSGRALKKIRSKALKSPSVIN